MRGCSSSPPKQTYFTIIPEDQIASFLTMEQISQNKPLYSFGKMQCCVVSTRLIELQ